VVRAARRRDARALGDELLDPAHTTASRARTSSGIGIVRAPS